MGRLDQKEVTVMRKYEIMYIIRPNIEDEAKKALVERFKTMLLTMVRKSLKQKNGVSVVLHTKSMISVKVTT